MSPTRTSSASPYSPEPAQERVPSQGYLRRLIALFLAFSVIVPLSFVMVGSAAAKPSQMGLQAAVPLAVPNLGFVDVALDGVAVAASVFPGAPQWLPAAVNDGDSTTRWVSDYSHTDAGYPTSTHDPKNDWIQIELAKPARVSSVVFTWQVARPASYEIQTSNDGLVWTTVRQVSNPPVGRDEQLLAMGDPVSFVRMQGTSVATAWGYSLFSFEIWAGPDVSWPSGSDVALGGTAVAASVFPGAPQWSPAFVNDDDSTTRWASDYSHTDAGYPTSTHDPKNDWIQIELAEPARVWSVIFNWQVARPASYEIQTSDDGLVWTTVRQVSNPPVGRDEQLLAVGDPVSFVRMQGTSVATAWGYSLFSFEIWSGPKAPPAPGGQVVPAPVSQTALAKAPFALSPESRIVVSGVAALEVGKLLAENLRSATGFALPVVSGGATRDDIQLVLSGVEAPGSAPLEKQQGYTLSASSDGVRIGAATEHGVFNGIQTLLQLLPPEIASDVIRPGPWQIDATEITDYPRYEYRGLLIDPARNFIEVDGVKSIIDALSAMKGTRLHMHLTDSEGWRVEIKSWPKLTEVGGPMSVPGGKSGFYTQEQFKDIVAYAAARFVEIVPEVEMPGHSGAARTAYPALSCGGVFCTNSTVVDGFINDVIGEISSMVNSKLFHIGGDESISGQQYIDFIKKVEGFVINHGLQMVGWTPIPMAGLESTSVHQYWRDQSREMVPEWFGNGNKVILSPTARAYLDYPYPVNNSVTTFDWNPSRVIDDYRGMSLRSFGLKEEDVIGIEGAAWGEKFTDGLSDVEYKTFPRQAALLDLAWSPQERTTDPESFVQRLAVQGSRWQFAGTNFWADTTVEWTTAMSGTVHRLSANDARVTGSMASFASPTVPIEDLSATIDWGDGTSAPGVLSGTSASTKLGNSLYEVTAEHEYADIADRTGTVTVTGAGGQVWTAEFLVLGVSSTPTGTPSTPAGTPDQPGTSQTGTGGRLGSTGADVGGLIALLGVLMTAGVAALVVSRRARIRREEK